MISYAPTPRQAALHQDPRERRWFCGGYGSAKTTAGVIEAFTLATVHHPGFTGIVCAPTFGILGQGFLAEWKRWIPSAWWRMRGSLMQGAQLEVRCPSGEVSTILLRSTRHPESLEAVNAAWAVFDEATKERRSEPFAILCSRLRRGYPGRQRSLVLTGMPMTRSHWSAKEFGTGPDAMRSGDSRHWHDTLCAVVRARTAENPYLPADYEAKQRARPGATKAWCAQFLDAQMGAIEGQVYEAWDPDVHVVPAASLVGRTWARVHAGVDWGWTAPGVMLAVAEDGWGNLFVTHEEAHQAKPVADTPEGWVPIAVRMVRVHQVRRFVCDPAEPGSIHTVHRGVRDLGARAYAADNDLAEGIRRVEARLEWSLERLRSQRPGRPGLYVSDACRLLVEEFESYARRRDGRGELTEDPEDRNNHALDALRYAVMDMTRE